MENVGSIFSDLNLSRLSLPTFRITDFIDIILVAVLIYIIIAWIKETRAWSLFKGIIVIVALCLLSYQFHFYTVSWIIEKTLSVGIIAIIVLFQPEFRKGLEQLGKGQIVANIFTTVDDDDKLTIRTIEEIITACYKMSKARTGALILLEQNVALGDLEETGIVIDAVVTSQLLINIFEDKTPLHDGAVLIRNNRIAAATCIMPLTQTEIGLDLGTRHRAAVGASEVSDAYVVVVSEETGAVSAAHDGKLYRNVSENELRDMLMTKKMYLPRRKISLWKGKRQ